MSFSLSASKEEENEDYKDKLIISLLLKSITLLGVIDKQINTEDVIFGKL